MGHEILFSTPKTSQMGHEMLLLTPKSHLATAQWATKSYFRRPKLHNGPRNLIFDAQKSLGHCTMGHEIVFSTPKVTWSLHKWSTKSYFRRPKSALVDPIGPQNQCLGGTNCRGPITKWATKNKKRGPNCGMGEEIFVAQVFYFDAQTRILNVDFFFRRPNFGLRPSDVENIFAALCLGRRKYMFGRRYSPLPKTLFLVVVIHCRLRHDVTTDPLSTKIRLTFCSLM